MSLRSVWSRLTSTGQPVLRGRVSRVSITAGGEVSIVVRFGVEEPLARMLDQGSLVELIETGKLPPKPKRKQKEDVKP